MSKQKKKPNCKSRLVFLYIFSFIVSVLPLVICFIVNIDKYVQTPSDTVKLSVGGALAIVFFALSVLDKLKIPRKVITFAIVFGMAYLLKPLLNDLVLLSGTVLIGALADYLLFQRAIRATKENAVIQKGADATASQVEEVIKKYMGGNQ